MGKIQILNTPSCIWLQRKAAVTVSAQNRLLICFLRDVSCSGFEEHHVQCLYHHHAQTGVSQPVLPLESKFISPPLTANLEVTGHSFLCTNSVVKALI